MANICENVLKIQGSYTDILKFDVRFKGDENYSFENLYPTPSLSTSMACEWRRKHWGVKGDFSEESFFNDTIRNGDMETYYIFDTSWNGPEKLIKYISKEFPELGSLFFRVNQAIILGNAKNITKDSLCHMKNCLKRILHIGLVKMNFK